MKVWFSIHKTLRSLLLSWLINSNRFYTDSPFDKSLSRTEVAPPDAVSTFYTKAVIFYGCLSYDPKFCSGVWALFYSHSCLFWKRQIARLMTLSKFLSVCSESGSRGVIHSGELSVIVTSGLFHWVSISSGSSKLFFLHSLLILNVL